MSAWGSTTRRTTDTPIAELATKAPNNVMSERTMADKSRKGRKGDEGVRRREGGKGKNPCEKGSKRALRHHIYRRRAEAFCAV